MSTITETVTQTLEATVSYIKAQAPGPRKLYTQDNVKHGDWRDELIEHGVVVVKGAIPRERALKYVDDIMSYLENL